MTRTLCRVALVLLLLAPASARAEIIDGYSAARNDRFTTGTFPGDTPPTSNPTFFLPSSTYDFSGVGWVPASDGSGTKQVAMISSQDFICAQHFVPGIGTTIAFQAKDGSYITRTVIGQTQISGSDVDVGKLNAPLPGGATGIASYAIGVGPQSAFIGQTEYMFGQHGQVGRNLVGLFDTQNVGTGPTNLAVSDYDPNINFDGLGYAQPSPPTDEFVVTPGDSGSPSFLFVNGQLVLLGHHMVEYTDSTQTIPYGSGDSFLSDYTAGIGADLALDGFTLQTVAVPEPTSFVLFGAAGCGWWVRRRRRPA